MYIIHRGRPKLVLFSVEIMQALCSRAELPSDGSSDQIEAVVDGYEEAVMLFDPAGALVYCNKAAKARFPSAAIGTPIAALSLVSGGFLNDAMNRVLQSGTGEALQIFSDRHPARELAITLAALPHGCMLTARDATASEEARRSEAGRIALAEAVEAVGATASFRLNTRGYLIAPTKALAILTGTNLDQLAGTRLLTLVTVGSRSELAALIDRTFDNGTSCSTKIEIIVNGDTIRKAAIGLAGVNTAGRIEEVTGMIALA